MRYPAKQKDETHKRIVQAAAKSFREHGSEGQGIAALMKDLGLTHGGFYKHFGSKEDLFLAAVERSLEESGDRLIAAAKAAPDGQELRGIIEYYLGIEHLEHVGHGCVIAALFPEIARLPISVRAKINALMAVYMKRLLPFVPGDGVAEKQRKFRILFPSMAGVLMVARAMADPSVQKDILAAAKKFYVDAFVSKS